MPSPVSRVKYRFLIVFVLECTRCYDNLISSQGLIKASIYLSIYLSIYPVYSLTSKDIRFEIIENKTNI